MAREQNTHPLALLDATLDSLSREAESLDREITAEAALARAGDAGRVGFDAEASAVRMALADSIIPLSAKGGIATPRDAYLEGLRRRRVRLQREGDALAEQMARLSAESNRLRAEREQLNATVRQLRERGADALSRLDEVHAHRHHALAWAHGSAQQRRRLMEWSE